MGSDHVPILLDSGEHGAPRPKYFHFENHWFSLPDFKEMIERLWLEGKSRWSPAYYSLVGWHGNLCRIRQHLKGWNIRMVGQQKKAKSDLL